VYTDVNLYSVGQFLAKRGSQLQTGTVDVGLIMDVWCIFMMSKRKPTYDLEAFKSAFSSVAKLAITGTALRSAAELGFGRFEIVSTIQTMERWHFYKSMTSNANNKVWQDVYYVPSPVGLLYVKFTADAVTELLLLSFKEKDDE
jgi:motility quorum-sensing regulator/GCU-specific mRNA interferase toxin